MHVIVILERLQELAGLGTLGLRQLGEALGDEADFAGDDGPAVGRDLVRAVDRDVQAVQPAELLDREPQRGRRPERRLRRGDAPQPAQPPRGPVTRARLTSLGILTIGDLAASLSRALGADAPRASVTGRWRPGDVRHIVASPHRAQEHLGFSAAVAFDDGMAEFAAAPLRAAA